MCDCLKWLPSSMASFFLPSSSSSPEVCGRPSSSSSFSSALGSEESTMSQEDDCSSLLSRLGSDSPRPRMKYGGMFCSVEGAFENKTLNFESFSPQTQRRRAARTQSRDEGQTVVFPSGRTNQGRKEVHFFYDQ